MSKPAWYKEAVERWWLSDEEIQHYGIDREPSRMRDYLSLRAFHARMRYDVNEKKLWDIIANKWFFSAFCRGFDLPHPAVHGLMRTPDGLLLDGAPLRSVADLTVWCRGAERTPFILKPVAGGASTGIFAVRRVDWTGGDASFDVIGRGLLSAAELEDQLVSQVSWKDDTRGIVLQSMATPHSWFTAHDLGPFNTLRIVSFVSDSGDPVLQAAILFSGRKGHAVNNWADGALSIHVDPDTGTLGTGRTLPQFGRESLQAHPDYGTHFEGLQLPDWQEVRQLVERVSRLCIAMRLVCWEVLLTESGPQLLEGNLGFGLAILQAHGDGFLKNGVADQWTQAGADLPDGSTDWVERTLSRSRPRPHSGIHSLPGRMIRKARGWISRMRSRKTT